MQEEFIAIKEEMRNLKNLELLDYGRPFVLRTDAWNTGSGLYYHGKTRKENEILLNGHRENELKQNHDVHHGERDARMLLGNK